ncbi:MAG: M1 family aminopeptidase [Gemmatimonadetes bacterium]|nr:M1 family aminopeptidase [Gemmatimonadota bacterium]
MHHTRAVGTAGVPVRLAAVLVATVSCADAAPPRDPDPGVPLEVAESRARNVTDLRYELGFTIPADRSEPILGEALIRFEWSGRTALPLDFAAAPEQVRAVDANGELLDLTPVNEHLVIPRGSLRQGANAIRVSFVAGDGSLNRNDEFLYALFVPDRARWAFPVFDQPDLKARFSLRLDIPGDWVAVSNGAELERRGVTRPEGERRLYRFAETEPISTYLFAFAAGRFEIEESERDGRTMRLFHRETDRGKVTRNREAIFDLHAKALAWLEAYTAIPYPFGKFDFVAVPSFQYGGMEHPGAIWYRASSLFLDESATQSQLLGRAGVIAHETAHMWFGDLVTMRWFDDVWMKEVFANFMSAKIVNPSFPELDHELRFLLSHYPAAYAIDRTEGANPIRQPLENLNEAGTLYGAIIYQKAPIVMRQLELMVGEDTFRDGLREYLDAHRFGNATWPDLIDVLDRRSPLDLRAWSRAWVEEPGRPTITTELVRSGPGEGEAVPRGGARVTFRQEDPRGRGLRWDQPLRPWYGPSPLDIAVGDAASTALRFEGDVATDVRDGPLSSFDAVLANSDGVGYGLFRLDETSREWLLEHLPDVEPPVTRAVAWLTLWDELLERAISPQRWIEAALPAIEAETDELLVTRMLADLRTAYWRFLTLEQSAERAERIETLLWTRLEAAERASLKASFLGAYRAVARSEAAIARLESIWRRGGGVPGLPLSERDLTVLAQSLAVRDVEGADEILDAQADRIANPDRRARFDFVRPALSSDVATRDAFFASLADPANREREPWALEGVGFLNHPLRAETALPHLRPALDLLEEIQRTGDIFFPKRWLDATLGGHGTGEAAEIVRRFLIDRPDTPLRLQAKLLQSADLVFRAAALRDPDLPLDR